MFRLVNGSKEAMHDAVQSIKGNELPVVLAEKNMTIYFIIAARHI